MCALLNSDTRAAHSHDEHLPACRRVVPVGGFGSSQLNYARFVCCECAAAVAAVAVNVNMPNANGLYAHAHHTQLHNHACATTIRSPPSGQ